SIAGDTLPPSRLAPGQFERNECIAISETPHPGCRDRIGRILSDRPWIAKPVGGVSTVAPRSFGYAKTAFTTFPATPVRRKSRPAFRKVRRLWSKPNK